MKLSRKSRFWIGGVLIAIGLISVVVSVYNGPEFVPPSMSVPNPNGYDDFVAAAKLRADVPGGNVPSPNDPDFSLEHAKQYVASSRTVLERVEAGLSKPTALPVAFTTNWIEDHVNTYPELKKLEWLVTLDGYISEQEGRLHDAVEAYVDGLKFGSAVARGGLLIDSMISIADERIALTYLLRVAPKLNGADCRFVLAELEKWKTNREPFELTAEREYKWADVFGRMQYGSARFFMFSVAERISSKSLHPQVAVIAKTKVRYEAIVTIAEGVQIRVAARAFELEHHSPPKRWSDLVPAYLPEIPIDPQTKRPLAHQFSE